MQLDGEDHEVLRVGRFRRAPALACARRSEPAICQELPTGAHARCSTECDEPSDDVLRDASI